MNMIQLSDHFTCKRLLRYVLPTIGMMLCTSIYSIVDGLFVSNFLGKVPLAAVNLIMPITMGLGAIGFMLGTGGSAVVATALGSGETNQANRYFSMLVYAAIGISLTISVGGWFAVRPLASMLGAEGELLENCVVYGRILFVSETAFILQYVFQSFFVVAERPDLSLKISVVAGIANVVLDYLFIAVFHWGIAGAAIATAIGQIIGGVTPIVYFCTNKAGLHLCKTSLYGEILLKACANGSSEMVTTLSVSVVNMLYNYQLMRLAGENGVAAYGVILYMHSIFNVIFLGYAIGSAPIVSYHYGAGNKDELKNLFHLGLLIIGCAGIGLTVLSECFAGPLTSFFVGYDSELLAFTRHGFRIYALAYLVLGFNVWSSSFFTALNNGVISAVISFLRMFLFQLVSILVLPILLKTDGIWCAVIVAESLALLVSVSFFATQGKKYGYR